jgi:DNA-binding NtrC family response regulator
MKETGILLLDFNPSSSSGSELRSILTSVSGWTVQFQQLPAGDEGLTSLNGQLCNLTRNVELSVGFLILAPSQLKQAKRILECLRAVPPLPPLIVVLEAGEPDEMFALLELGFADFIAPPLTPLNTLPRVRRLLEQSSERRTPAYNLRGRLGLNQLIGESRVFRAVKEKIQRVARCDANVLISGDTGTGKELCARAIHYLSPRAKRCFIPVNCGAFPTDLVENELFGHERGAFTSALSAKAGLIHEADGGTLFLDEIDCLNLAAQVKLLRFLQEKEYRPLGSPRTLRADTRVIAAANVNFEEAVRVGNLREDLYYRLNVIPLPLPPLRERREDIPLLAVHFLNKYASEFHRPELTFSADALEQLPRYDWPGNIRELEHLIERAVALADRDVIGCSELNLLPRSADERPVSLREAKVRFERSYVENLLMANKGNITRAANAARKNRRAFWELIRKHNIDASRFKVMDNQVS